METVLKGVYRKGRVDLERKPDLKDGSRVIIIPMRSDKTQIDVIHLLMQQRVLEKFWGDKGEDLYG